VLRVLGVVLPPWYSDLALYNLAIFMVVFCDSYFGSPHTRNGQIVKILVYQDYLESTSVWHATSQGQLHCLPISMAKVLTLDCSSSIFGLGETAIPYFFTIIKCFLNWK
jgi:hypothetical protein